MSEPETAGDRLRISMTVSELESAREVLAGLESLGATIHADTLEVTDATEPLPGVDLSELTVKQWETLVLAYEWGYYERPREADLADLAEEFGISKSAVSQRLRAAESTVVNAVVMAIQ